MNPFENVQYWHISEVPKGWTIGERVGATNAMRGVGVQSNANPALITHMRPIAPATYDDEGSPTTAADEWLLAGDMSNVTRDDVVQVIAAELGVNPTAVDAKIQVVVFDHSEVLQFIADNAAAWGEVVG